MLASTSTSTAAYPYDSHHINKQYNKGMDKKIRLYDLARPDAEPFVLADAGANVRCCSWIQADALLLCSLQDRNGVAVYDVRTQRVVGNLDTAAPVTSIDVTYDGAAITTADKSHVRMWDAGRLTLAREFGMEFPVEAASYCPAKGLFAVGGEDMWVRLFSAKTGVELECNKGHHGPVHTIRFNPHGTAYASGSEDGTIRLWMVDDADDSATKTDQQ